MNQKICLTCRNSNSPDKSFCTNCGQPLPAGQSVYPNDSQPTVFSGSPNAPGFPPNQSNFSQQAPPINQAAAPAKKSNKGIWLAVIGIIGFFGILIVGAGVIGAFVYFKSSKRSNIDIKIDNSNTYSANTTRDPFPTNSSNTSSPTLPTSPTSSSMSENDKYRIFYAAAKVNDQVLTTKVSKRIGIIDDSNKPTAYYKTFITGMFQWAAKDVDFVKRTDTKEKGMAYIKSQMPDLVP